MPKKIPKNSYESRLLKGGNTDCRFIKNDAEIIALINVITIFVTYFDGFITNEKDQWHIYSTT